MSVEEVVKKAIFEFIRDAVDPVELTWFDSENTSGAGSMTTGEGLRARVLITPVDSDELESYHYEGPLKVFTNPLMMIAVCTMYGDGAAAVKRTLRNLKAKKDPALKAKNIALKGFSQSGNVPAIAGSRYEETAFITLEFAYVDIYSFPRDLIKTIISTGTGDFESEPITIIEP